MNNLRTIIFTPLIVLTISCQYFKQDESIDKNARRTFYDNGRVKSIIEHKDGKYHGKVLNYDRNGKLKSKVFYNKGHKEGTCHNYYPSGKIHSSVTYVNNIKEGLTYWYYENGKPYRITKYYNGERDSIETKFYESGKVMSRAPYKNGEPGVGLEEYDRNGKNITPNYKIKVTEDDRTLINSTYYLRITHSGTTNKVNYYQDKLEDGKYLLPHPHMIPVVKGVGEISIRVRRGEIIMAEIPLAAKIKTSLGNYYVTSTTYNLAIQN